MINDSFYDLAVIENIPFGLSGVQQHFFALRLEAPKWARWFPGQFIMLRPQNWTFEIPWGRAFSISKVTEQELVIFFQVTGRGTELMRSLQRGDRVHVWGPLGNRFTMGEKPTLLLAGGIGIAPFLGYIDVHPSRKYLSMLFGHRHTSSCYPLEKLSDQIELTVFHEKNSQDRESFLQAIRSSMEKHADLNGLVLACGPLGLLKFVQKLSIELSIRTQLSLETRMACGVGACLGCVTQTTEKWPVKKSAGMPVPTCTQGPIFWADQISLEDVV